MDNSDNWVDEKKYEEMKQERSFFSEWSQKETRCDWRTEMYWQVSHIWLTPDMGEGEREREREREREKEKERETVRMRLRSDLVVKPLAYFRPRLFYMTRKAMKYEIERHKRKSLFRTEIALANCRPRSPQQPAITPTSIFTFPIAQNKRIKTLSLFTTKNLAPAKKSRLDELSRGHLIDSLLFFLQNISFFFFLGPLMTKVGKKSGLPFQRENFIRKWRRQRKRKCVKWLMELALSKFSAVH